MKFIILSSININSGTGIRLFGIAKNLSKNNDVILTGVGEKTGSEGKLKYKKIHKLKSRLLTHMLTLLSNFIVVISHRADVIIASKPFPSSCLPAIFGKMLGRMIVLDIDDLEYGYWKKFESLFKNFDKVLTRFFDKITTHTEGLRGYIERDLKIPKHKIVFLPQGIDCGMFENVKTDMRKRLSLEGKKIVVYAAHLGPAARLEFVLGVFKDIARTKKDITLLVVGGGEYLERYKRMAESMGIGNHVIFTGHVKHENIPEYMAIADAAINYFEDDLANKYRSSIKLREYLASGTQVICNIVSDDIQQFSSYVNTFMTGDADGMIKQIVKAIERPDKTKAEKGREFIKKWDWSVIVENFEKELSRN